MKIQDFFRKFLKGILYPAAYPEVIAVGATTSDGTVLSGSAIGNELEFLAPGSQIISKEQTKIATELAYAEVISYNRKNLEREFQNESPQQNRRWVRTKRREEEL